MDAVEKRLQSQRCYTSGLMEWYKDPITNACAHSGSHLRRRMLLFSKHKQACSLSALKVSGYKQPWGKGLALLALPKETCRAPSGP
jgi:hypothetical protein